MAGERFLPATSSLQLGPVEVTEHGRLFADRLGRPDRLRRCWSALGLTRASHGWQVAAEFLVEHLEGVMRDMFDRDPRPYTPLVVTLALFIGTANLLGLVPGHAVADGRLFDDRGPGGGRLSGGAVLRHSRPRPARLPASITWSRRRCCCRWKSSPSSRGRWRWPCDCSATSSARSW